MFNPNLENKIRSFRRKQKEFIYSKRGTGHARIHLSALVFINSLCTEYITMSMAITIAVYVILNNDLSASVPPNPRIRI